MTSAEIAGHLRERIRTGGLTPGSRLPPIRKMAREWNVAPMTVVRAYARLREEGLVESRTGSGTYVASRPTSPAATPILAQIPERGPLNLYEPLSEAAGTISLASSVPDPAFSPLAEILPFCFDAVRESEWTSYYAPPGGMPEFVDAAIGLLAETGIEAHPDEVMATFGGTHARYLVVQVLSQAGEEIALETPGWLGGLGWMERVGRRSVPIPRRNGILDLAALDRAFRQGVRLLFTMPTYGSTTGDVMPEGHREEVLALAGRYGAWIVEDASYARLGPPGPRPLAGDQVVTVDSFSYCASPGLRLGYVRAPRALARRLGEMGQATVQSGVTPLQAAVGRWIGAGGLGRHLRRMGPIEAARRGAMAEALRRAMPPGTRWTGPIGGLSLWVTLPPGRYGDLYEVALAAGVPFAPGSLFVPEEGNRHFRLSYGRHAPEVLASAVERLAGLVRARIA